MKLTIEEDPQTIRRYAHIKAPRGWKVRTCSKKCPDSTRTCTLERGHRRPHVAHDWRRRVVAVWEATGEPLTSPAKDARAVEARARNMPRTRSPTGVVRRLRALGVTLAGSLEEIALLIFFAAFVWFAIDWMLLILR